jgi:hypothetical protein
VKRSRDDDGLALASLSLHFKLEASGLRPRAATEPLPILLRDMAGIPERNVHVFIASNEDEVAGDSTCFFQHGGVSILTFVG